MLNPHLSRGSALALLAAVCACGPDWHAGGDVDPYNGVIDNSSGTPTFTGTNTTAQGALASAFQPNFVPSSTANRVQCNGATACYLPTAGWAAGQAIKFFIAGKVTGTTPPFPPNGCGPTGLGCTFPATMADHQVDGGGGFHADVFPHSCKTAGYDPVQDSFPRDQQWPIVDSLPLNNANLSGAHPPLGLVSVYSVSGISGETCNDLKYSESITSGKFGAQRSSKPSGYEIWMIFDPTMPALLSKGSSATVLGPAVATSGYWFRGLQASYLDGGAVPVDANGNLIAMDGVILDGASFAQPTDDNAVILPAKPGDDGFSPIVRLHDFTLPSGKKLGDYKGVCNLGDAPCEAAHKSDFVLLSSLSASAQKAAFNTVFLAVISQ